MITELSIIIVNYRVYPYLDACLQAVSAVISHLSVEIFVVDNDTNTLEQEKLLVKFPLVRWICLEDNIGFAKANNLALQKATGTYLLFLNPDTLVDSSVLNEAVNYLKSHEAVGAVGVQMCNGAKQFLPESKRELPSILASIFKLIGLAALFPNSAVFNQYALGHLNKNEIHQVPVLAGAFMMMPMKLVRKLGGFDESFFMYGEDIDLSIRVEQNGFENHYLGHLAITHFKGASSGQDSAYLSHFYGSMIIFIEKYRHLYGGAIGVWCLKICIRFFWWIAHLYKKLS